MEIRLLSLLDGARAAAGTAVIIDVFRAYTTAALAFARGAARIVLVAEVEEALELRARGAGDLCLGEVGGKRPEGFDFGNSPAEMSTADVRGKNLVQSTRAGTVGAAAARNAEQLYVASLVNAGATAAAIRAQGPSLVCVVAMGREGRVRSDEDEHCGLYLRNLLEGRRPAPEAVRQLVLAGGECAKFRDPEQPQYLPEDLDLALRIDSVDFAIRAERCDGLLVARPCARGETTG